MATKHKNKSIKTACKSISLFIPMYLVVFAIQSVSRTPFKANREHIMRQAQICDTISAVLMVLLCIQALPQTKTNLTWFNFFASVSICCFTLHPSIGIWGWTNWIFPVITTSSCKGIYFTSLVFYNLGKTFMYWVFALRIRNILKKYEQLQMPILFWSYIIFSFVIPTFVWIYWMVDVRSDVTPHGNGTSFKHCYPMNSVTTNDNSISVVICIVNVIFCLVALIAYFIKWYQIENYVPEDNNVQNQRQNDNMDVEEEEQHQNDNMAIEDLEKLQQQNDNMAIEERLRQQADSEASQRAFQAQIKPAVKKMNRNEFLWVMVLCTIAMVSTFIFTTGILVIEREIGFFLSVDSLVNSWCIFLLKFEFCQCRCKVPVKYGTALLNDT